MNFLSTFDSRATVYRKSMNTAKFRLFIALLRTAHFLATKQTESVRACSEHRIKTGRQRGGARGGGRAKGPPPGGDPASERRPSWRSFDAERGRRGVVRARARPIGETSTRECGPIYENLACHSDNEVQRKSNTFDFFLSVSSPSFLSLPFRLPALAPARSSFTPRERDHKRTSGPPGASRRELNGGIFRSLGDDFTTVVCV